MNSPPAPHPAGAAPAQEADAPAPEGGRRWSLSGVPPDADRVPFVRRQASAVLHRWQLDDLTWPLELLLTELVANVVRHAHTLFDVVMSWSGHALRCEVTDADPTVPRPRPQGLLSLEGQGGRGLLLVEQIAQRWGVEPHERGKTVWFELAPE